MLERRRADSAGEAIASMRRWADESQPAAAAPGGLARLELDLPPDARVELPVYPRVRWRSRAHDLEMRGWGAARSWNPASWRDRMDVPAELGLDPGGETARSLRWFLWGRFDAEMPAADEWSTFGVRRVVVPLIEWRRENERCFLACNLVPGREQEVAGALTAVAEAQPRSGRAGGTPRTGTPEQWFQRFEQVQQRLAARDDLEKIVLARFADVPTPGFAPGDFLATASEQQPDGCAFLIQPEADTAFFGVSPERLFRRRGRTCESEALAGTRSRGTSPGEDEALARELASATKDRREQGLVLERILTALGPLAERIEADPEPVLRRLREVQHLCTGVRAELLESTGDGELLAALHPTPAVAGQPPQAARAAIADIEGFDRGLYAGPVGCASVQDTDVTVGIRSALWRDDSVRLFAGAGLLPASSAGAEWDETEAKMGLMLRMLLNPSEGACHDA